MRLNYLDSIGYCKALCQDTGTTVTGRLVYFGAGRYCLQQGVDLSLNGDTYTAFRTDNIFHCRFGSSFPIHKPDIWQRTNF